jgi:glucan phosphoethanolaminetransferase (alkaline phosphatase superfamily)
MINKYFKTYNSIHKILNFFIFFIIALYPLYIFPSGSIQISHFLLLIFSVLVFMFIGISLE